MNILYSTEDKEVIGRKLKALRLKYKISQANIGIKAFGMTESGGQTHVRKIEIGKLPALEKDDIEKILSIFNISFEEFEAMEDPGVEKVNKLPKDPLVDFGKVVKDDFYKIWPDGKKYFRMLEDAYAAGDEELIEMIKIRMAVSMRKQATKYDATETKKESTKILKEKEAV